MERLTLDEIKQEEVLILQSFDGFCEAHGLNYSIAYGTLLGAVRHQGFIPWDDDIDVVMPRPDYESLIGLAKRGELPGGLEMQATEIDGFAQPFAKIVNKAIAVKSGRNTGDRKEWLWIDVFPVDGVPDLKKTQRRLFFKEKVLATLAVADQLNPKYSGTTLTMRVAAAIIGPLARSLPIPKIASKRLGMLCRAIPFGSSRKAAVIAWGSGVCEIFPTSYFLERERLVFEGQLFEAPRNAPKILAKIYGERYMELPPESERVSHELCAYRIEGHSS